MADDRGIASGGYSKPAAYDAEDERIRAEFKDLDLTEEEQADLNDILRLRLGDRYDQAISRRMLHRLRNGLAMAVQSTLRQAAGGKKGRVIKVDRGDAWRVIARDGLGELHARGKITARQFDGGRAFRLRHEASVKSLRSTLGTEASSITPTVDEMVRSRTRLAIWERDRVVVEGHVLDLCGDYGLALLRAVAGEAKAISAVTRTACADAARPSETDRKRALLLLGQALDICANVLPQVLA